MAKRSNTADALDPKRLSYDERKRRLTYEAGIGGKRLLPKAIGLALSRLGRSGEYEGRPLDSVAVRFEDQAAATHNSGPLKFLGLTPEHPGGAVESADRFTVREDWGIEKE